MNTQKKRLNSRSFLVMLFVLAVTSFVKVSPAESVLMLPRTAFASAADRLAAVRAGGATPGVLTPQEARRLLLTQSMSAAEGLGVKRPVGMEVPVKPSGLLSPRAQHFVKSAKRQVGMEVVPVKPNEMLSPRAQHFVKTREVAKAVAAAAKQAAIEAALWKQGVPNRVGFAYTNLSDASAQLGKDVFNRLGDAVRGRPMVSAARMVTPGYAALSVAPVLGGLAWKGLTADTSEIQAQLKELENARMPAVAESWGESNRAQAYWDKQAAAQAAAELAAAQAAAQVPAPGRWESFRSGLSDALTGAGSRFANVRQSVGDWYTRGSEGLRGYLPKSLQDRVTSGQVGATAAALTGAALTGAAAYGINRYRKAQAEKRRLEQEAAEELDKTNV